MKGILLVGYGSREPDAAETMAMQADNLSKIRPEKVYTAFYRVNTPSIPDAMKQIASDGVDELAVVPLLISDSSMTSEIIPGAIGIEGNKGEVEVDGKKVRVVMSGAIGTDDGVPALFCDMIEKYGGKSDTPILFVGHGSKDNKNPDTVRAAGEAIMKAGYSDVTVCFNEFNTPTVEEAFAHALGNSKDGLILALPMFIADGVHLKKDIPPKIGIAVDTSEGVVEHDGVEVKVIRTPSIGQADYFCKVISTRVDSIFKQF